ncbi:single-stranded-DNA-specific exonuclease RecJ [Megamonas hypermegale]|uniref:single-stranded-DNA-specific exonuclease RecJ n=1 Tax=Megamonas hypermegale TaxID=158847 RepID=UPI0026F0A42E|nr:single-stranded-DNA-specific exonuclease RecJ [Megamonas hypermegale]
MKKYWEILPVDEKKQQAIMKALHISPLLAQILARKNFSPEETKEFLNPAQTAYHDPFLLKDMDKACARLAKALAAQEKICIYGDYDVDGISSTALLVTVLKNLGMNVDYYLPDRHSEGYGLHTASLDKLIPRYDLIVTVDCGITAIEEIAYAKDKIDIIITDHHLPREALPEALAIVNPNQAQCPYPCKNLCGVGVAFKLCQALYQTLHKDPAELEQYLDIVALGTVADIVPLIDENRRFVQKGLNNIRNLGMQELLKVCNYETDTVNTGHIGFGVAPRLNAAGRLTHASNAVELLLTDDKAVAAEKSRYLDAENKKRQDIVEDIFNQAVAMVEKAQTGQDKIIIVVGENWHEGVIGIAASRLQEKYYRPIIIIAVNNGIGKASCRSIEGFHMKNALDFCADDFVVYGGHSMAAGFTIEAAKIAAFTVHIKDYAEKNVPEDILTPVCKIEAVVYPQDITLDLIHELSLLEPFGMGNTKPQFVCQHLYVSQCKTIGRENTHLRFVFEYGGQRFTAIGWNMAQYAEQIAYKYVDIVFQPEINHWNDKDYIQFKLSDIHLSDNSPMFLEKYPSYDTVGKVYLAMRRLTVQNANGAVAVSAVNSALKQFYNINISEYALKTCLKIIQEINIISLPDENTAILNTALQTKMDINTSPTFARRFGSKRL